MHNRPALRFTLEAIAYRLLPDHERLARLSKGCNERGAFLWREWSDPG